MTAIKNVPEFKKWAPNSKQRKRDAGEPLVEVIPRDSGVNFDVRLGPVSRNYNYAIGSRIEGDVMVITVDRILSAAQKLRLRRLVETAMEVAGEEKP
jgi:hypothetical protein